MMQLQEKGDYVEAEECRKRSEDLKKQYEKRRLYEMDMRHNEENEGLKRNYEQELQELNKQWQQSLNQHESDGDRLLK